MSKGVVVLASVAGLAMTVLSASPANALILTPVSDTKIQVSAAFEASVTSLCGYTFTGVQRMKIGGEWMWIPTQSELHPGRYTVTVVDTCSDGANVYAVGGCNCLEASANLDQLALTTSLDRMNSTASVQRLGQSTHLRHDKGVRAFSQVIPADDRHRGSRAAVFTRP